MIRSSNTTIDRIMRVGLATPALALTIVAGAAVAQQGGSSGTYEVIVETEAQDKADKADKADAPRARVASRKASQQGQVVVEVQHEDEGNTLTVRRVNDDPIVVKLNGKVLKKDEYSFKDGVVTITTRGNTFELRMPTQLTAPDMPFAAGRVRLAEPPVPVQLRGNAVGGWVQDRAPEAIQSQPKVMLGVVMGEPEATTVEHLGLDAKKAVLLERVVDGLPADKAGLQDKDIIIGFGEKAEPRSADEIRKILAKAEPGTVVKVKVIRKGHPKVMELKLEAFNAQALGRAPAAGGGAGQMRLAPQGDGPAAGQSPWGNFTYERDAQHSHMEKAQKAMKEAAEMLARMEHDIDREAADAYKSASKAIEQAIAAMREGEQFGLEIEDMRRLQEEAVARLRGDMAAGRNDQRFWADRGDGGQGFALTFPDTHDEFEDHFEDHWGERLEELEDRLDDLEDSFDRAIDRLEDRTEAMIERLMERLERALEDRDDGRRGR